MNTGTQMQIEPLKLVLTVPEAMELLDVSRGTIYDLLNSKELKSYTVGRRRYIRGQHIMEFLDERARISEAEEITA